MKPSASGVASSATRMPISFVAAVHDRGTSGISTRWCSPSKVNSLFWRAVDQEGNVLDILVQRRRTKRAPTKFFPKLPPGLTYVPRVTVTDKLKSYGAAKRELLPGVGHRQHRYLDNRVVLSR